MIMFFTTKGTKNTNQGRAGSCGDLIALLLSVQSVRVFGVVRGYSSCGQIQYPERDPVYWSPSALAGGCQVLLPREASGSFRCGSSRTRLIGLPSVSILNDQRLV